MNGEAGTCNGNALEPNCTIRGEGITGPSDVLRTYKRRRRVKSASDSKPRDDGRGFADVACQLADQGGSKDIVMQNMNRSLNDNEAGIQEFTRDETRVEATENGSIRCTVTEKCQLAFVNILKSEKFTSLSKLLSENFQGAQADRLLNLKVIKSRMKDGAYEQSPMFFLDDVQQAWRTIQTIGSEMTSIARSLSDASRSLYIGKFGTGQADFNVKLEHEVCNCRHCGDKADGKNCLVCDSCEEIYHISCIIPPVDVIPLKSWYCTKCTAIGIGSPHENCVVCEKLNVPSSRVIQDCDGISLADEEGSKNLGICKICDGKIRNMEDSMLCEHPYCPNKYYHVRCLTNKQKKSYGPHWYCFSCLCRLCLVDRDDESIVLCDGCDNAYHIYCMIPPRATIPEGKWFCGKCEAGIERIRTAGEVNEKIEKKRKTINEECNG